MTEIGTDSPKLTIPDIALMRQIIAWRKANGVDFVKRKVYGAPYWVRYTDSAQVVYYCDDETPVGLLPSRRAEFLWFTPTSFGQAVDVLVAFGYLPSRFSTAYRDGWSAGYRTSDRYWDPEESVDPVELERIYPAVRP